MEKPFHFDTPSEIYQAGACVISCCDARFDLVLRKLLKRRGLALRAAYVGQVSNLRAEFHSVQASEARAL
jgi:hypothetical protein